MENSPYQHTPDMSPSDLLNQFIGAFAARGWLDQQVRISHRDRRYRLFCSREEFSAYRVNDNCGLPPGVPGWPVCMVSRDHILDDSAMSAPFPSGEPGVHDWLQNVANDDLELI